MQFFMFFLTNLPFLSTLFPSYDIKTALSLDNAITFYFSEITLKICEKNKNNNKILIFLTLHSKI